MSTLKEIQETGFFTYQYTDRYSDFQFHFTFFDNFAVEYFTTYADSPEGAKANRDKWFIENNQENKEN